MAFGFSNPGAAVGGGGGGGVSTGPDLETIQTEALGFLSVAGDAKVRLTAAWPALPSPTSSLLSIASRKGLVAAAGPDQLVVASTESVRKALESPKEGDSDVRPFEPQLRVPMPMRVAQVAFTADEAYLVLSAESGGGLAVYDVQALLQGSTAALFELSTNGEPLRSLAPNPTPDKAELCAVVTTNGNLHVADLRDRRLGNVLKSQVSCVSWSSKGKQLCAGLADGTIHQMTPEGEAKADIPKPPGLGDCHVSSLTWLENNLFLSIHTTTNASPPSSIFHVITREPPATFIFQKLADPVEPFNSDKLPHHNILRLRDFQPNLQDLLIVSSTASSELGLLTRSRAPLATDKPAPAITGHFTTTELLDDTKRPTLPMTDLMDDSTPVGIAIDLSSRDTVYRPIPSDEELEESPGPLPGLWLLTHEGVLCSWWVVYTDSIKAGTTYSGFAALEGAAATSTTPKQPPPAAASAPSFGNVGASAPAVGATPAFGSSSKLGQSQSPWATAPALTPASSTGGATFGSSTFGGTPASGSTFGKPSAIGFGQSSQLGMRTSPWSASAGSGPTFGQSGFASFAKGDSTQSPLGAAAPSSSSASGGGFSSFAKQGGFASIAGSGGGGSVFGGDKKPMSNPFASASANADTAFPARDSKPLGGGLSSTPFKLQSSFKADASQGESDGKPARPAPSMFGNAFESALGDAGSQARPMTPPSRDEDMDAEQAEQAEETPQASSKSAFAQPNEDSTTPTTTPVPARFGFATPSTPGTSLFGRATGPVDGGFSSPFSREAQRSAAQPETPKVKAEERDEPLPPDTTSKASFPLGESSSSSAASAANKSFESATPTKPGAAPPLPSDFVAARSKPAQLATDSPRPSGSAKPSQTIESPGRTVDDAPLPPDFVLPKSPSKEASSLPSLPGDVEEESDFEEENASEGSGVDVAKEMSPAASGLSTTPGHTPHSSFGGLGGAGLVLTRTEQDRQRPLFGEISRDAPVLQRPSAPSARSPSPLRGAVPQRMLKADATRSVSAPGMASQMPGVRKTQQSPLALGGSIMGQDKVASAEDQFVAQQRRLRERQEAEEAKPLVDQLDDEVQRILGSEIEGTLELDEFVAHSNVAPPARESIPCQVEAVYRDVNSMIDTLGLNVRSIKAFIKGHTEGGKEQGRTKDDLDDADDWVLCEVSELGEVLDEELYGDLGEGRVRDLEGKADACQDLGRDMQRLRVMQENIKRVVMARLDPEQAEVAKALPLSAEQAAQQNELRRELANLTKLLAEAEEALTLLKTKMASATSSSGRGSGNVPTVEAVMRTIGRMTSMAEKRSGDVDVLETQMRKLRMGQASREGSPMVASPSRKSVLLPPPESTPLRNMRQSLSGSVMSLGGGGPRAATPRKKVSGFSGEEKRELMAKKARRRAVLSKFETGVEEKGVGVWNMEDIE